MALADLVVVMNDGRIEQAGTAARGLQRARAPPSSPASSAATTCCRRPSARGRGEARAASPIRADRITVQPGDAPVGAIVARRRRALGRVSRLDRAGRRRRRRASRLVGRGAARRAFDAAPGGARRAGALCRWTPEDVHVLGRIDESAPHRRRRRRTRQMARKTRSGFAPQRSSRARRGVAGAAAGHRRHHRLPDRSGRRTTRSRCASSAPACRTLNEIAEKCKADLGITLADDGARLRRRRRSASVTQPNSLRHRRHRILDAARRSSRPATCRRWTSRRSSTSTRSCRSSPPAS